MSRTLDRRSFLKRSGAAAVAIVGAALVGAPRAVAAGDRLVIAVGQWGIETPFAWRTVQSEKPLWDCLYDPLIQRDSKTWEYRPGLATEWKPSNDLKVWTFKLRPGVKFHESWGELTAEDVKFTVEQNLKPDAQGGSAPYFRRYLDRIETPAKQVVDDDPVERCHWFLGYPVAADYVMRPEGRGGQPVMRTSTGMCRSTGPVTA